MAAAVSRVSCTAWIGSRGAWVRGTWRHYTTWRWAAVAERARGLASRRVGLGVERVRARRANVSPAFNPVPSSNRIKSAPRSPRSRSAASLCGGTFDFDAKRERLTRSITSSRIPRSGRTRRAPRPSAGSAPSSTRWCGSSSASTAASTTRPTCWSWRAEQDEKAVADVSRDVDTTCQEVERLEFKRMFAGR